MHASHGAYTAGNSSSKRISTAYDTVRDSVKAGQEAIEASGMLYESIYQRSFRTMAAGVNLRDADDSEFAPDV